MTTQFYRQQFGLDRHGRIIPKHQSAPPPQPKPEFEHDQAVALLKQEPSIQQELGKLKKDDDSIRDKLHNVAAECNAKLGANAERRQVLTSQGDQIHRARRFLLSLREPSAEELELTERMKSLLIETAEWRGRHQLHTAISDPAESAEVKKRDELKLVLEQCIKDRPKHFHLHVGGYQGNAEFALREDIKQLDETIAKMKLRWDKFKHLQMLEAEQTELQKKRAQLKQAREDKFMRDALK